MRPFRALAALAACATIHAAAWVVGAGAVRALTPAHTAAAACARPPARP